jgi:archaemetzincin
VKSIQLLPIGPVDEETLVTIGSAVGRTFGLGVFRLDATGIPEHAFDRHRQQYSSELILRNIVRQAPAGVFRILAVTDADLFIPMLTFVFGQAQLRGMASVVSTARMRQEFYGLSQNRALMLKRIAKESLHELGHTFGLTHCLDQSCLMSVAVAISQIDVKGEDLCRDCSLLLNHLFSAHAQT